MNYDIESLILNHLDLARSVAISEWRTATHALQKDEMIALANLGLVDAANRWEAYCKKKNYDPAATQFFQVFARLRIRGTIRDQIRKDDWATRTLRSKSKKLKDAGQDEGISVEELAERTEMSVAEIRKVNARLAARPVSLDAHLNNNALGPSFDGASNTKENQLQDLVDTESTVFEKTMLNAFTATLNELSIESKIVLVLHYYSKMDLRRIAEELKMPESRVSQLHSSGALAVRQALVDVAQERG